MKVGDRVIVKIGYEGKRWREGICAGFSNRTSDIKVRLRGAMNDYHYGSHQVKVVRAHEVTYALAA